jgi:hypothetical protein
MKSDSAKVIVEPWKSRGLAPMYIPRYFSEICTAFGTVRMDCVPDSNILIRFQIWLLRSLPLLFKSGSRSGSFPKLKTPCKNVYSDCLLCVTSLNFFNYFSCY